MAVPKQLWQVAKKNEKLYSEVVNYIEKWFPNLNNEELKQEVLRKYFITITDNMLRTIFTRKGLKRSDISASNRKFTKKEFNPKVARGLYVQFFDIENDVVKLAPNNYRFYDKKKGDI